MSANVSDAGPVDGCPHLEWFNPLDLAQVTDPFPEWARGPHEAPVFFSPVIDAYVVTRYADVVSVVTDPATFSSAGMLRAFRPNPPEVEAILAAGHDQSRLGALVALDPPLHTRVRKVLGAAFTPRRIALLEQQLRATVDELIDA